MKRHHLPGFALDLALAALVAGLLIWALWPVWEAI